VENFNDWFRNVCSNFCIKCLTEIYPNFDAPHFLKERVKYSEQFFGKPLALVFELRANVEKKPDINLEFYHEGNLYKVCPIKIRYDGGRALCTNNSEVNQYLWKDPISPAKQL
jgi:hypothetical protein